VKLIVVIATISLISTQGFAAAQGGGKPRTCRQEVEACMKRLMALRDPVSVSPFNGTMRRDSATGSSAMFIAKEAASVGGN
jgi:hypothetical protein